MRNSWGLRAAAAAVGAALVFWVLLPDRTPREPWWEAEYAADPDMLAAFLARRAADSVRRDMQWRWERANALARISEVRRASGLVVLFDPEIPEVTRRRIEQTATAELRILGLNAPKHPIIVRVIPDTNPRVGYHYSRAVVLPAAPAEPCGVLVRAPLNRLGFLSIAVEDRLLGTCAFFAAYGMPGEGMSRWLRDTRMQTARYLTTPAGIADDTLVASVSRYSSAELKACLAGILSQCDPLVTPMQSARPEYPGVSILGAGSLTESRLSGGLLGALASELGDRRFAAIWTSERAPAEAYERSEGRALSLWVAERVARFTEPYERGPGPGAMRLLMALLIAGITVVLATSLTPRRLT